MATRPIRYELHIKPLMRLIDRENMSFAFDLWHYDDVVAHADKILLRTNVDMPPPPFGGPWPSEWVATFQRWKDEGFLRLDLGTADASGYTATLTGGIVTLSCRGTTPIGGYRVWLDATVSEGQMREYTHYWEPPLPPVSTTPTPFRARAKFQPASAMTSVAVNDAAGLHDIPITASPGPMVVAGGLTDMQRELEGIGAAHLETVSMMRGSASRFRLQSTEFDVFSDAEELEIEGPAELMDHIKRSLSSSRSVKFK